VVCQRPLPAQALFCPACGSSQVARPSRRCPTCQRDIPRQSVYCPYCRTATSRPASNRYEEAAAALPAAPAAPARPDLSWLWAGLVFIAGVALALFLLLGDVFRPQTVAPAPLLAVNTAKGSITVGAPAYIDGSGLDVWEPITLASIPVWDLAPGQHVVCDLPHGTPVQVLEIRLVPSEHRHYFRVLTEGCEGWVPELALGSVRRALPGQQS